MIVATLIVRIGVLFALSANLGEDPDAYRAIAEGIRNHGVYGVALGDLQEPTPTAYRPPLYPILLSPFVDLGQGTQVLVGFLHVVLGTWTVVNVYRLAESWGIQRWRWLPCLLVACDPLLAHQSSLVMSETIAAWMTTLCLLSAHRWTVQRCNTNSILLGCVFGFAILCRPTFLAWYLLVGLIALIRLLRDRRGLAQLAVVALATVAVIGPWAIRNQFVLHAEGDRAPWKSRPIIATTHGGYTLLLGNNPSFYEFLEDDEGAAVWHAENEAFQSQLIDLRIQAASNGVQAPQHLEPELDQLQYRAAINTMRENPLRCAHACLLRVGWLWSPIPRRLTEDESVSRRVLRMGICGWYLALYATVLGGLFRFQRARSSSTDASTRTSGESATWHPWLFGIVFCVALTLLHALFWSNLRMRAPLIPILAIIGAFGIEHLLPRRSDSA